LDICKFNDYSKRCAGGAGTQTAALAFGGKLHLYTGATEEYDGTNWTSSGAMEYSKSY
jgi:hypothetical protein